MSSWALPLGVMAETMRFDVWDAIDGVSPPSMRKYVKSKKERDVKGFTSQSPRPRLCPSLSATTVDGTAYQEVVSPMSSRSATPHTEMRREGLREAGSHTEGSVPRQESDLSLLAASMHAATSRAGGGEGGAGCGVDLEKAAAALKVCPALILFRARCLAVARGEVSSTATSEWRLLRGPVASRLISRCCNACCVSAAPGAGWWRHSSAGRERGGLSSHRPTVRRRLGAPGVNRQQVDTSPIGGR